MKMNNKNIALTIAENLSSHIQVCGLMEIVKEPLERASQIMLKALFDGGKIFFCGNGGSAADAQHLAAELSGRYLLERRPLDAIALHCNTSALTAIGNDYGYDMVFARQLEAHGRSGDVLVAISTGGSSPNVIRAAETARSRGIGVVAMTGAKKSQLMDLADVLISIPSTRTPRIQEMHILVGHTLCEIIERGIFEATKSPNSSF